MLIELLLVASGGVTPLTVCDPPESSGPTCYGALAGDIASQQPGTPGWAALGKGQPVKQISGAAIKLPAAGALEAQFLKLTIDNQLTAVEGAAANALHKAKLALSVGQAWDGKQLDASRACFGSPQATCLVDQPLNVAQLRAHAEQAEKNMGLVGEMRSPLFEAEMNHPAWTLAPAVGINWKTAGAWRDSAYALMLMHVVQKSVAFMADTLKTHYKLPRAYTDTWNGKGFTPQPVGAAPANAGFPATHVAAATAAALVMARVTGRSEPEMLKIAQRVGERRALAGLHTQVETEAGTRLGRIAADAIIEAAQRDDGPLRALLRKVAQPHAVM